MWAFPCNLIDDLLDASCDDPDADACTRLAAVFRNMAAHVQRETKGGTHEPTAETQDLLHELQRVERTALEGRITAYFADFSRTTGRRVELDEDLNLTIRNEDATRYRPDQLSHGARDQLYLAVYLATTVGFDIPFILDDPFVNCDTERLAAIRTCWDRLTPDHQLILLSHNPEMAAWAPSLEMREAA